MPYFSNENICKAIEMKTITFSCPSCSHSELSIFYEVRHIPVHSCLMLSIQKEALDFPGGDVILGLCHQCGFITNVAFDSKWSAYASNYEDQQSFSPTFNQFAYDLANSLIKKYDLHQKNILEIGCSKGDFLFLLCELGHNYGVGIDPSAVPGRVPSEASDRVTFIADYYSERYAQYSGDFVCCRHTLEHISPVADFLKTVRSSLGDRLDIPVFFEIPDTTRVLQNLAFEDIYYEHCSYFTPGSLARLFRCCGFAVNDLYKAYADQYLLIEAQPIATPSNQVHLLEETVAQTVEDVEYFSRHIGQKLEHWQRQLSQMQEQDKKVVIWGSGSKCVAFLTTLNAVRQVEYIVDINPHRQGKFIPGLGKEIVAPAFLQQYQPDFVIVMNPIYCHEIQQMLNEMGVAAEVVSI